MSEFKFACPVCGQHITADSNSSGSQLECPTCFRKIVVPQAPASTDPKFILSAAEANRPRPPRTDAPRMEPVSRQPARTAISILLIALFIALCSVGVTLYAFREKNFKAKPESGQLAGSAVREEDAQGEVRAVPAPTNDVSWNLDLADAAFPDATPAGKIRGEYVLCNRSSLTGGALGFRQTTRGLPDLSVTIYFFAKQAEELRGKSINVATNDAPVPRVTVRWKEGKDTKSQSFTNGYALKLELGDIAGNRIPGKVYLSLPDQKRTRVAGTFSAEIRKPAPPKPRPAPATPKPTN